MFCKESLTTWSEIFEIFTPIVVFLWFLYSRWAMDKSEFFKDITGLYGGYVSDTFNASTDIIRYDGAMTMEILDVNSNGYIRGQFEYDEKKITLGKVGGPDAISERALESINFIGGKLSYHWSVAIWKKRNPLISKENRIYFGEMYTVNRLDTQAKSEEELIQGTYKMKYFREGRVFKFTKEKIAKQANELPNSFKLTKSYNHLLDPYTTIKKWFSFY